MASSIIINNYSSACFSEFLGLPVERDPTILEYSVATAAPENVFLVATEATEANNGEQYIYIVAQAFLVGIRHIICIPRQWL